jgi:hypothetical protein
VDPPSKAAAMALHSSRRSIESTSPHVSSGKPSAMHAARCGIAPLIACISQKRKAYKQQVERGWEKQPKVHSVECDILLG